MHRLATRYRIRSSRRRIEELAFIYTCVHVIASTGTGRYTLRRICVGLLPVHVHVRVHQCRELLIPVGALRVGAPTRDLLTPAQISDSYSYGPYPER